MAVGELIPLRARQFVAADAAVAAFAGAPAIDAGDLRAATVDANVARAYGRICAGLAGAGRKARGARSLDLLIAATALSTDLPLFRRNPEDFRGTESLIEIVPVAPAH